MNIYDANIMYYLVMNYINKYYNINKWECGKQRRSKWIRMIGSSYISKSYEYSMTMQSPYVDDENNKD